MNAEPTNGALDLRALLAQRVHVPDLGLEKPGDRVKFSNEEEAEVTVNGQRMKLITSSIVVFELKPC